MLDEALRTVPDDPSLHNAMSTVLAKRGRTVEAMAHARRGAQARPRQRPRPGQPGQPTGAKGDPAGAKAAYEAALRIDPIDADAHGNLGLILTVEGRTAEAEVHLAEALRHNPGVVPHEGHPRRPPPAPGSNRSFARSSPGERALTLL